MTDTTRAQDVALESLAAEHGRVKVERAIGHGLPGQIIATVRDGDELVARRITRLGTVVEVERRPYVEPIAYAREVNGEGMML